MNKEIFEEAVIHANICLKKWRDLDKSVDHDRVRSLVLTVLNKAYSKAFSSGSWRLKRVVSKQLNDGTCFDIDKQRCCISYIMIKPIMVSGDIVEYTVPYVDYDELNIRTNKILLDSEQPVVSSLSEISFKSLEDFKFG